MRTDSPLFRLTTALTTGALLLASTAMTSPARAQQAPDQVQPDQAPPDQNQVDPPARVGRLARVAGQVSYHAAGDTEWTPATMNFPVASGGAFWTQPDAQAELELSSSRIGMAGGTELDIGTLDATGLHATLTQGEVLLRPRDLAPGESWTVQTPRGSVTAAQPGRIAVTAGDTDAPTTVAVLEGTATLTGPGLDQTLNAGQAATITGTDTLQVVVSPAIPDAFVNAEAARDRPPLPQPAQLRPAPAPPAVAYLPGGNDLAGYGAWNTTPDYGEVWYPTVDPGWVPYRQGHWAFIAPWGWTWVDDAPWGFAPFHYGRWVQLRGRWAWAPEFERGRPREYPVYAPALVTFVGIGAGIAIGAALASGSIGWIPLGPREPYRPWFRASPRYLGELNRGRTAEIGNAQGYRNHAAATMVPASAMIASRPIRPVAQPIAAQTLATARPLSGTHPIQPTMATAGVTPRVAQQMHLAPAPAGFARPVAPGPAIMPHAATALPALRPPLAQTPGQAPGQTGPHVPPQGPGPAGVQRPLPQVITPPAGQPHTQPFAAPNGGPRPGPQVTTPPATAHPSQPFAAPNGGPRPGPQVTTPPVTAHPSQPFAAPNGGPRPGPQVTTPPAVARPSQPFAAPNGGPRPGPQVTTPPVTAHPAPSFAAPPPVVQRPTPQFAAPSAPAVHPAPQFTAPHIASPPPAVQRPTPQFAAPPAPVQHFQPPPQPRPAAPPPQIHAAPPPQPHPAPAPQQHQKRPGEP